MLRLINNVSVLMEELTDRRVVGLYIVPLNGATLNSI